VSLQRLEAPRLWIVAGPNGSGKSTLYDATDIEGFGRSVWIINPDLLTARLREQEGLDAARANGEALDRIAAWLRASIEAHQTVGVETVLSTPKYRELVERAKLRGFEIRLLFVMLRTAELSIERVRMRVAGGGHDVPEDRIRSRRERSFAQLPWFLDRSDVALIYDNSGAAPVLVARKRGEEIELDPAAPSEIRAAVEAIKD
jgi:predicted ABC-type ATPase